MWARRMTPWLYGPPETKRCLGLGRVLGREPAAEGPSTRGTADGQEDLPLRQVQGARGSPPGRHRVRSRDYSVRPRAPNAGVQVRWVRLFPGGAEARPRQNPQ